MVLRSIRTVMATRGMAMATAGNSRYSSAPPKLAVMDGKLPWTNTWRMVLKIQVRRMPVKKGGTAMQSWLKAVAAASSLPPSRPAARTPRGMDTATIKRKLSALRHSVTPTLGAISSHTGWR